MSVIKSIALFIVALAILLVLPMLLPSGGNAPQVEPAHGLPWQIERLTDGRTRVFGIMPGSSTYDEARRALGGEPEVAMILAEGDSGSVEAYFDSYAIGPLTGKLILTLDSTPAQREQMLTRARKSEYMKSATKRITLGESDLAALGKARVTALTFIPGAQLDEQIVLQRFGAPAERIRNSEHTEHFLYPEKGLDIQIDKKGKELLQYVAPADFQSVLAPLRAGTSSETK